MFLKDQECVFTSEQCYESFVELTEDWFWQLDEHLRRVQIYGNTEGATAEEYISNYGQIGSLLRMPSDQVMAWSDHQLQLQKKNRSRNLSKKEPMRTVM